MSEKRYGTSLISPPPCLISYYLIVYYEHYRYLVTWLTYLELCYCMRFQTTCLREARIGTILSFRAGLNPQIRLINKDRQHCYHLLCLVSLLDYFQRHINNLSWWDPILITAFRTTPLMGLNGWG